MFLEIFSSGRPWRAVPKGQTVRIVPKLHIFFHGLAHSVLLTKGRYFDFSMQFFVGGIDSFASIGSRVFFSQIFDKEHNCSITRLLFSVDPIMNSKVYSIKMVNRQISSWKMMLV